jgi:hypothetical protein
MDRSVYGDVRYHFRTYLNESGKLRLTARSDDRDGSLFGGPVVSGLQDAEGLNRVVMPFGYYRGQLTAGGFLGDELVVQGLPRRTGRNELEKSRWVDSCAKEWAVLLGRYRSYSKVKGPLTRNNFSLSLDSELTRRLTISGVSAPVFLERVLERVFARYLKEQGYASNDSIGYVYGFHMDTNNLHIQMSVFPRTKMGAIVRVSDMVRSSEKTGRFINNMTRYACEAAVELEKEYLGRGRVSAVERPIRELAQSLFRSDRVASDYITVRKKQGMGKLCSDLESALLADFQARTGCGVKIFDDLRRLFRRYVGGTREQESGPIDFDSGDAGGLERRLCRIWLGYTYEKLEDEETKEGFDKGVRGLSVPGFPVNLVSVYKEFWRDALTAPDEKFAKDVGGHLKRKRSAVAKDIQSELDLDVAPWISEFSGLGLWFEEFLLYLDKHLLFGSGVFFSKMGLQELKLAVKMRVVSAKFLGKDRLGLDGKPKVVPVVDPEVGGLPVVKPEDPDVKPPRP